MAEVIPEVTVTVKKPCTIRNKKYRLYKLIETSEWRGIHSKTAIAGSLSVSLKSESKEKAHTSKIDRQENE